MENMVNFWQGKKVFITGHTGFKGSWLSLWLQQLKADVIGFSLEPPTVVNLFSHAHVAENMVDIRGDIRNYQALHETITQHQPEIIFHLAAQSLVRESYVNPLDTYSTNVMGTVNLLEAALRCDSVRAIVNVTTDKCYENKEWHWGYRENEAIGGHDPYSNSKACSELVTSSYRNSFYTQKLPKVGLASARAGNVIGGGDWGVDRLIPDLMYKHFENKTLKVRFPHAIRPWQHVLDALSGYLRLAELLYKHPDSYAEAWNFGPAATHEKSVQWVIEKTAALLNNPMPWEFDDNKKPHEATYLKLDCSKAINKLQWQPRLSMDETLKSTIDWYQAFYKKMDLNTVCRQQISAYVNADVLLFT